MTKRFTKEMSKIQSAISEKMRQQILKVKEELVTKPKKRQPLFHTWDMTSLAMNHPVPCDFLIYDECPNCHGDGYLHDGVGDWSETCKVCNGEKKVERPITPRDLCQEKVMDFLIGNLAIEDMIVLATLMRDGATEIRFKK